MSHLGSAGLLSPFLGINVAFPTVRDLGLYMESLFVCSVHCKARGSILKWYFEVIRSTARRKSSSLICLLYVECSKRSVRATIVICTSRKVGIGAMNVSKYDRVDIRGTPLKNDLIKSRACQPCSSEVKKGMR